MRKHSEILNILKIFQDKDPNPRCELDYTNAYTLLIAVLLSAQSTDKGVNKATKELFKVADTPQKMINLGIDNLKQYIKTIDGYWSNLLATINAINMRIRIFISAERTDILFKNITSTMCTVFIIL